MRVKKFDLLSARVVSIVAIIDSVTVKYIRFVGLSMILYTGTTLGKNEYATFPVVLLLYEAPMIIARYSQTANAYYLILSYLVKHL